MANKFERLLSNPPTWREIPVEYQGEVYTVRGRPDARLIGSTVYLPDPEKQLRAHHYKAFLQDEAEFDLKTVGQILLVHRCLQTEEGQPQLDETDVAQLAVNHGVLFLALVGASLMAVGLADPEIPAPAAAVAADPLSESGPDGSSSAGTV